MKQKKIKMTTNEMLFLGGMIFILFLYLGAIINITETRNAYNDCADKYNAQLKIFGTEDKPFIDTTLYNIAIPNSYNQAIVKSLLNKTK